MAIDINIKGFIFYLPEENAPRSEVFSLDASIESIEDLENILKIQRWVNLVRDPKRPADEMTGFFRSLNDAVFGTICLEPSGHLGFVGNNGKEVVYISFNPNEGRVVWRVIGNDLSLFRLKTDGRFEPIEIVVEDSNE